MNFMYLNNAKCLYLLIILSVSLLIIISNLTIIDNETINSEVEYVNLSEWHFGKFLINNSNYCVNGDIDTIILVHSSIDHFDFRSAIRNHFISLNNNSKLIFVLGNVNDKGSRKRIWDEFKEHHDIVQGSFIDSYHNLTLKHILGLTWAAKFCPSAQLVLKVDDDIFVNYPLLEQYINQRFPKPKVDKLLSRTSYKLIVCYVQHEMKVIRNKTSKWFVPYHEYPKRMFPDFCSGWAYLTTIEVINDLLNQIQFNLPIFWIDDVYVTGILKQSLTDIYFELNYKWFNLDPLNLYKWIQNENSAKYKWRYIFSNTNGDINLLKNALMINKNADQKHLKCCFPPANNIIPYFKPKLGSVKEVVI